MKEMLEALEEFEHEMEPEGWTFNFGTRWKPTVRLYRNVHSVNAKGQVKEDVVTGYGTSDDKALAFREAMRRARDNHSAWVEKVKSEGYEPQD